MNNLILDSMQRAVEFTSGTSITFANNVIDGLWVNSASPSSIISAIDVEPNVTGSVTFTSNTLQDLLPSQVAFVNASASKFQTSGMGNVGFDPTVAGPTLFTGSADAGAAKRTASCTTPVSLVLGDAGAPDGGGGAPDGGGGEPDAGSGSASGGGAGAAGGSAASGGGEGGGGAGSGTGGAGGKLQKPSGCSCSTTESRMPPAAAWAIALASLATWRRRRRP